MPLNFRDLIIRLFVIAMTSLVLIFVTRDNSFDLHLKIRKIQSASPKLLLVEIAENLADEIVIENLKKKGAHQIWVSHFLYDQPSDNVVPYSVGEKQHSYLNIEIKPDSDGLFRRVEPFNVLPPYSTDSNRPWTINFRGPPNTFPSMSYYDLIGDSVRIRNQTIIIKPSRPINNFTTPVGLMTEAELVANIADNIIEDRFIPEKNVALTAIILFILLILTTASLIYLPSTLALVTTAIISVTYVSLSLWIFDNYYIWTPVLVPMIQMVLTFLLITNYKFVLNEKTRWGLEKESLYFEEVEEMKTNFLSLFSHDLKTPLAKIIGIADTLRSKVDNPEILAELEKIHLSSKDLEKYIKRILKMSQVQSKNISLNKEPVDLNTLIEKSVEQNRLLASEKNITLETNLSPLFMVDVDGPLVQEVIINFIENAITYSPAGRKVTITSEEINDFVKISVKDEGKGVPKDAQESIWEKYYRFDTQKSGYGLGLFLSRYVITLHGGQVFLNSKENRGSEFGFIIPISEGKK